jgi:thioredoxin 2
VRVDRAKDRPKCGECGKPMLLDRPFPLGDDTFDRVIAEAGVPVLVDFYADWCGPCKMMAPEMDAFASKHAGKVLAAKLDTDRHQVTAQKFGIRGIPTLIRFADGKKTAERSGAMRLADIERFAGVA